MTVRSRLTLVPLTQTFCQFAKLAKLHFIMPDTSGHFIVFDSPSWFFEQLDAFLGNPDLATRARS
jgi:hypothetical protein